MRTSEIFIGKYPLTTLQIQPIFTKQILDLFSNSTQAKTGHTITLTVGGAGKLLFVSNQGNRRLFRSDFLQYWTINYADCMKIIIIIKKYYQRFLNAGTLFFSQKEWDHQFEILHCRLCLNSTTRPAFYQLLHPASLKGTFKTCVHISSTSWAPQPQFRQKKFYCMVKLFSQGFSKEEEINAYTIMLQNRLPRLMCLQGKTIGEVLCNS